MTNDVQISILIPVFNRKDLVGDAIRSALSQVVDGLEVIVIDNHSDDGTWECLQEFRDQRLRVIRNEANFGIFGNFDRCAGQARGEFALFLCSDDRLVPGFVAKALELLKGDASIALLSSRGRLIDEHGSLQRIIADRFPVGRYDGASVVPAWFWTSYNYGANPLNYPSGVLFRTAILKRLLPFRSEFGAVADVDMFLRVLRHGNLYISKDIGCYVMRHSRQAGLAARKKGELMRNDLQLLGAFREELESYGIYKAIDRQISCLVLASLVRVARVDLTEAINLFHVFGRNTLEMAYAVARRVVFVMLDRLLGYRLVPYLKELE
jgi:glycosyltransferase involved in cell wall biosynthesis